MKEENKNTFKELELDILNEFIRNNNHEYHTTHKKVCFFIIQRIYRRVILGHRFGSIKVSNDLVIDGNHRYIAYKLANIEIDIIKGTRCFSDVCKNFSELEIDTIEDWDKNHPTNVKYCTDDFLPVID